MRKHPEMILWRLLGGSPKLLPPAFWWLWVSILVNRVANFVVPFCVLYLTTERSMSDSAAGLLIGLYGLGAVAGSLAGGTMVDHFGAKRVLTFSALASSCVTFALGIIAGMLVLSLVVWLIGVFGGMMKPASNALIAVIVEAPHRVRAFALSYWAMNLGFAIACLCAGFMAAAGYTTLFCTDAASTAACGLLVFFMVPDPGHDGSTRRRLRRRPAQRFGTAWAPLYDKPFLVVAAMNVVTTVLLQQLTATLPLAMRASGHSPATYGAVAALNGVLVCVLQMPISQLSAKKPLILSLTAGAMLMSVGFGLTAVAASAISYALTLIVWTIGEIVAAPAAPALVAALAGRGDQGAYQGILNATWGIGAVLGPVLGTTAFAAWGAQSLWLACGLAGIIAAAGFLSVREPLATRFAPAERAGRSVEVAG